MKPQEVETDLKNILKYRFKNIKKGNYYLSFYNSKPQEC
jgi:hypothetical protein